MMNSTEPIPVIPLEYAKPDDAPRRRTWLRVGQVALAVSMADLLVGWTLIAIVDAETVIATAPVLFTAGAILLVASLKIRLTLTAILGLAHGALCLLFTMLVNVRNWSPDEATAPFTIIGAVYALGVAGPMTVVGFRRMRALNRTIGTRGV